MVSDGFDDHVASSPSGLALHVIVASPSILNFVSQVIVTVWPSVKDVDTTSLSCPSTGALKDGHSGATEFIKKKHKSVL